MSPLLAKAFAICIAHSIVPGAPPPSQHAWRHLQFQRHFEDCGAIQELYWAAWDRDKAIARLRKYERAHPGTARDLQIIGKALHQALDPTR